MKNFTNFILESRGVLNASSEDHMKRYVTPFEGSKEYTHVVAKDAGDLQAGTKVKIKSSEWDYPSKTSTEGKWHAHVVDEKGKNHYIPISKLHKPGEQPKNKGHDFESSFIDHLKKHGIMPKNISGAGSTSGTDFVVENKKKNRFQAGKVTGEMLEGETKEGVTAAMGQLTVHHSKDEGWHIEDQSRVKRPKYAEQIEKSGVLDHMNKHYPNPEKWEKTESGRAKTIELKHPNLNPAKAYLMDHHVKILHVGGGFGTYKVGAHDETGHGLPALSGHGKWRIREKAKGQTNARTIAFHPDGKKGLNPSHVNLEDENDIKDFKKTLGYKK